MQKKSLIKLLVKSIPVRNISQTRKRRYIIILRKNITNKIIHLSISYLSIIYLSGEREGNEDEGEREGEGREKKTFILEKLTHAIVGDGKFEICRAVW